MGAGIADGRNGLAAARARRLGASGSLIVDVLVLQHIACEPLGVYEDVLDEHGATLRRIEVDAGDALPDWHAFDAIVAMGGPMSANDDAELPWLRAEKELVAEAARAGTPFWGVCLGVQLLAASLGARVYAGAEPEVGVLPVELTEDGRRDAVFSVLPATLPALQWHGDTFDLPPGAVRLAGSPAYPNQAFRFANAYGVQFHLEVSAAMAREWMDVPAYASALEQTIGAETLLHAVDERVDEMLELGRALFERWLDRVVRSSSLNAVRLEA